ncbi:MAG: HD domain-containing protein [Acidobacteriota bacterium]|nr:HD domain-containing protein [Blastocatellia bacterium]MDW8239522.1 HD domain-containing protein [Acidobacteriota bacterium]
MAERIYRDPVHNIIALDQDNELDRLLIALIDTPEFQRLRRIRQLGLALYVYQGAEHSRFVHSLGVMHLMRRILTRLGQKHHIDQQHRRAGCCAALLHDIGHGPFSHVIESLLGYRHEDWSVRIIMDPTTTLHQVLVEADAELPAQIVAVIEHRYQPKFINQLVSSQLDVDRFDYLLRDSLMTGAKYGVYDMEWIVHALELDPVHDFLFVSSKGLYAVEEYLQARYYMFRQVYFHRALRTTRVVLKSIFQRAMELSADDQLRFKLPGTAMGKLLGQQPLTTDEYLQLDDHDMMFYIKQWTREPDAILSDLANRFLHRRLLKSIDLKIPDDLKPEFMEQAERLVSAAGFDPRYYLGEDRASDIPYWGPYSPQQASPESGIYIAGDHGQLHEIASVSPVVAGMQPFQINRLCFPEQVADAITALIQQFPMAEASSR